VEHGIECQSGLNCFKGPIQSPSFKRALGVWHSVGSLMSLMYFAFNSTNFVLEDDQSFTGLDRLRCKMQKLG